MAANWSSAAWRSSTISAAITSGRADSSSPPVTHPGARRFKRGLVPRNQFVVREGAEALGLGALVAVRWVVAGDEVV
jgi:hypothetical protein